MTFTTRLKEGTKKSHNAAENTKFVSQFLKGVLDPEEYRKLITDFYLLLTTNLTLPGAGAKWKSEKKKKRSNLFVVVTLFIFIFLSSFID